MDRNAQIEQKYPNGTWVDGLYMVDSTLKAICFQEYNKTPYAAKVDSEGFYVPPYVKRIEIEDDSFNFWNAVTQWIMTDSVEYFSLDGFYIYGFEFFRNHYRRGHLSGYRAVPPACDKGGILHWSKELVVVPVAWYRFCRSVVAGGESHTLNSSGCCGILLFLEHW